MYHSSWTIPAPTENYTRNSVLGALWLLLLSFLLGDGIYELSNETWHYFA